MGPARHTTEICELPQIYCVDNSVVATACQLCNRFVRPQYHISAQSLTEQRAIVTNKMLVN